MSHGPRAVGIVARRAAIARAPQADLELILSGSEPLADVVVHVLEVRYIQRTGGDPVLASAEGAVRIGRGRGVTVMDTRLLDGDALHRGGRPVVGAVDHDGDVMRARSRFAVGILHADGEVEFHLVAELELIGGVAGGFGLRERVLAGLGVQMERAVVGYDGSVRLDGGNRDLGLRTVGERQMADHVALPERDGVVSLVGEVIRQLALIAGVHVGGVHLSLVRLRADDSTVVLIETGFRHRERILGLGDDGRIVGAVDGDGDGLFGPCSVLVAHVDGEGIVTLFRRAVGLEAELVRSAALGGVQRVDVLAGARINSQGAVRTRGRMMSAAHAGVVTVRVERGVPVACAGAYAVFERGVGVGVSTFEGTGDGEVFRDFIMVLVVAGITDDRVARRSQGQSRPVVGAHDVDRDVHGGRAAVPVAHGDGEDFLLGLALREGLRLVFVDRVGIGPVLVQDDGTEFGFQRNVAVGVRLGIADEGRAGAFLRPDVEGQGVGGVGILDVDLTGNFIPGEAGIRVGQLAGIVGGIRSLRRVGGGAVVRRGVHDARFLDPVLGVVSRNRRRVVGTGDRDGNGLRRPRAVLVTHVDGELVGSGLRVAVGVEAGTGGVFVGLVGVGIALRIDGQRAVPAFNHDLAADLMERFAHAGLAVGTGTEGEVSARFGLHVLLAERHAVAQVRPAIVVVGLERPGNGGVVGDVGLFGDVELDFSGLIVGHDRDVVAVGGFNQIERGPIVGALDLHGQHVFGCSAVPVVDGGAEVEVQLFALRQLVGVGPADVEGKLAGLRVEGERAVVRLNDLDMRIARIKRGGDDPNFHGIGSVGVTALDRHIQAVGGAVACGQPVDAIGELVVNVQVTRIQGQIAFNGELVLAGAYPCAADLFSRGGIGVVLNPIFGPVIDPLFLQFDGSLLDPRRIVDAVQGNGDGLGGGRAVLVGDGHFEGLDLGFVLAESLDRVGGGFIGPLSGGGIEGQRAVVRGERGVRVAVGPVCAVSARAGGVLAASDMEGLIRPGVAVVVGDREGAVDGQIAALRDVPVATRDVEGGDVVGAVDGHGDGLRRPRIVLVAHVDGEGFVNGVAFGELIKGVIGLAVELKADVFAFALHSVGVGAIGVDRQAAVLAARHHGRGRAARGGGVGRVEYGRIERLAGSVARSRTEVEDMPCVDVIAAGGSGVGGMAREGGVFLARISGGGVGVVTAHAVLDHMEVAVAAEQIVEIVVGQIKRGDVVGAVDGDGDGLGHAPAGLGVGDVDGEGLGHGLAEGEVVDGIAVRACFAGILVVERVLVGAVRAEGQGAVGGGVGIDDVPGAGGSGSGHSGGGAAVGQARSCVLDVEVELVDIVLRGARPVFLVGIGGEDLAGKGSGLMLPFARSAGRRGRVAVAVFRGLVDALFLEVEMEVALIGVDLRDVVGAGDGNGDGLGGGRAVLVGNGHFKGFDLGFPGIELLDLVAGVVERIGPLPGGGIKGQLAVVRGERGVRAACGGVGTVGRAGAVGGGRVAAAFDVERLVLPAVAVRVLHGECAAHGGCVFVDALRGVGDGEFGPVVGTGESDGDFLRGEAAASVAHVDGEGFGTGFAKSEAVGIGISVVDGIGVGPVGDHCHHAIGGDDAGHLRPVRVDEAEGKRVAVGVGAGGPAGHGGDALVEFIAAGEHAGFDDAERAADAEGA